MSAIHRIASVALVLITVFSASLLSASPASAAYAEWVRPPTKVGSYVEGKARIKVDCGEFWCGGYVKIEVATSVWEDSGYPKFEDLTGYWGSTGENTIQAELVPGCAWYRTVADVYTDVLVETGSTSAGVEAGVNAGINAGVGEAGIETSSNTEVTQIKHNVMRVHQSKISEIVHLCAD